MKTVQHGTPRVVAFACPFIALFAAACGSAPEEASSVPDASTHTERELAPRARRPKQVPAEFVATPAGYFHPSCVVSIGEDETVHAQRITSKRGPQRDLQRCKYPRYDKTGKALAPEALAPEAAAPSSPALAVPPPAIWGWVESASSDQHGPLNWVSANWIVPEEPAVDVGQTIYYFPGLQPLEWAPVYTIMQPVLAWNSGRWTIASWNCCAEGSIVRGPEAEVHPGDTLFGYVEGHGCDAQGVCSQWRVYTGDWTNGAHSMLNTSAYGNRMGWAFGGALEAYGVDACDQYPASGTVTFTNLQVRKTTYQQAYPVWNPWWTTTDVPQCGYSVSSPNTNTVSLEVIVP